MNSCKNVQSKGVKKKMARRKKEEDGTLCRHYFIPRELKKATCTKNGKVVVSCVKCRYSFIQETPALGHCYQRNENGEKFCIRCGRKKTVIEGKL